MTDTRPALRKHYRAARRALSRPEQDLATDALFTQLSALPAIRQAGRIGAYHPNDGELSPWPGLRGWPLDSASHPDTTRPTGSLHTATGRPHLYLPVVSEHPVTGAPDLLFAPLEVDGAMAPARQNQFGIAEPTSAPVRPSALDVVLVPLVAFDAAGNRLGMGGGFYDRAFAHPVRPLLIGIGHECQAAPELPRAAWDIPMDGIVTPQRWIECAARG